MNISQIDRFEMFQATNDYLDSHTEVWNGIPIVANYKNRLTMILSDIKEASLNEEMPRNFFGSSLRMIKKNISDKMDILDDTLEAYAEDIQNEELRAKASNSSLDYFSISNEEFENKVVSVIGLLEENVEAIVEYGMSQGQIDDAKLTFNNYLLKRGQSRVYNFESRSELPINSMYDKADEYLKKLDRVIKRFKRSNPSFYLGYLSSRQVIVS